MSRLATPSATSIAKPGQDGGTRRLLAFGLPSGNWRQVTRCGCIPSHRLVDRRLTRCGPAFGAVTVNGSGAHGPEGVRECGFESRRLHYEDFAMCGLCSLNEKERRAEEHAMLLLAADLKNLAIVFEELGNRRMKPHSDECAKAMLLGRSIIKRLAEECL